MAASVYSLPCTLVYIWIMIQMISAQVDIDYHCPYPCWCATLDRHTLDKVLQEEKLKMCPCISIDRGKSAVKLEAKGLRSPVDFQ